MALFWFAMAVFFLVIELITLTFGFIFMTVGAVVNTFLISANLISENDYIYQIFIMLFFGLISFLFFYKSYKRLENNSDSFKEDMDAIIIDTDLTKGKEGKIRWSGTICNAMLNQNSSVESVKVNSIVTIREFKGNIAIVDVDNN